MTNDSEIEQNPFADFFDYNSFKKIKWKNIRVTDVAPDHVTLHNKSGRRLMVFIIYKSGGAFHLHGQNIAYGPFHIKRCCAGNFILSGDLQRVLKALVLAPTKARPKRREQPPLFPFERRPRQPSE